MGRCEPGLILRAHVWLAAGMVPLLVRLLPLQALVRIFNMAPPVYRGAKVEEISGLVRRRLANPRHMKRRACLREGLVLFHVLRLTGRHPALHFGVYPSPDACGRMHAHCWVTLDDATLTTPPESPHAELWRFGPEERPTEARRHGEKEKTITSRRAT